MAERLHVDAPFVHEADAGRPEDERPVQVVADVAGKVRVADDVQLGRLDEMAVDVDHFDPPAADRHLAPSRLREQPSRACQRRRRCAREGLHEVSAIWHGLHPAR